MSKISAALVSVTVLFMSGCNGANLGNTFTATRSFAPYSSPATAVRSRIKKHATGLLAHLISFTGGGDPVGQLGTDGSGHIFGVSGSNTRNVFAVTSVYTILSLYQYSSGCFINGLTRSGGSDSIFLTSQCGNSWHGFISKLTSSGSSWSVAWTYNLSSDVPAGPVTESGSYLYGALGPAYSTSYRGLGAIYRIGKDGTGFTKIWTFTGSDVANYPAGRLAVDTSGDIYGTIQGGSTAYGLFGCYPIVCGAVFKLAPSGSSYTETSIYDFDGTHGAIPNGVVLNGGKLYGTTSAGGSGTCIDPDDVNIGCGVVYKLTSSGSTWSETVLHNFTTYSFGLPLSNGADSNGYLWGTSYYGGTGPCSTLGSWGYIDGCGFIYTIKASSGAYQKIYDFQGSASGDGALPAGAPIVIGSDVWGTTSAGGTGSCNCGTVWAVNYGSGS